MRNICIENSMSAVIGGGIRFSESDIIYTTNRKNESDSLREHNLNRFGKVVRPITEELLYNLLYDNKNNIQLLSNDEEKNFLGDIGLATGLKNHEILTKNGLFNILQKYEHIKKYIPSYITIASYANINNISTNIINNFFSDQELMIKHPVIDGNGKGVYKIFFTGDKNNLKEQLEKCLKTFSSEFGGNYQKMLSYGLIIQECVPSIMGEGSITFSIQNNEINSRGLANNIVDEGEYFASTNIFPYFSYKLKIELENQLYNDFYPLLFDLKEKGIRGIIGFDVLFKNNSGGISIYVIECNGLHRTTGSSLPNAFSYNTGNSVFFGIPLSIDKLSEKYYNMSNNEVINLSNRLLDFGNKIGESQIINFKYEGLKRGHPCVWIGVAGKDIFELEDLFFEANIVNNFGKKYAQEIFSNIK